MSASTLSPDRGDETASRTARGFDLLSLPPIRALFRWRFFPDALKLAVLATFVALAVLGWGLFTPEGVAPKLYAKANLANLTIWGLWWPAVVALTFFFGRAWCLACPLELVARAGEAAGRSVGLAPKPLAAWIARGSLVLLFFAVLQLLVPGIQIHRVPHHTSVFLWVSLGLAFAAGAFFKDRAFCRGFCPVALLLNAYGRGGMLAVRPAEGGCCAGKRAPDARACPSLLNPSRLDSNKDCLVCGECVKAGEPGSMRLLLRPLYPRDDAREALASWPLTLFVMMVSGFVTYELTGVWKAAEPWFLWAPKQMTSALGAPAAAGWIQGMWTIALFPLALWLVLGGITVAAGGARSLGGAWRRLALPMAVVVAAGHMAKGLEKFVSWAGFFPGAWADPAGVNTALALAAKTLPQPTPWLTPGALSAGAMGLVALGLALGVREARLAAPAGWAARALPVALLGGFFFLLVWGWGGWMAG